MRGVWGALAVGVAAFAAAGAGAAEYPDARWRPAHPRNYDRANRPLSAPIRTIVIHTTEGSYAGTVRWFAGPRARAATHYVVRSRDGEITQMVLEKDAPFHSGNGAVNATSIGIEHEAFVRNCAWYTDAMYRASAQLSAYLATKYLIPIDRRRIIGHNEVVDPARPWLRGGISHHSDPGRCWDWPKYMALVRDFAGAAGAAVVHRIVDEAGASLTGRWGRTTTAGAYGRSFATARAGSSAEARFRLSVPAAGRYAVYAWWPRGPSRSASVPIRITTAAGVRSVRVNQRATGDGWTYLGTFPLLRAASVRVSARTDSPGSVAADAVKAELVTGHWAGGLASESRGWRLTRRALSWTDDAGASWRQITPPGIAPGDIRGVHFTGADGWLVASTGNAAAPLALRHTGDQGRTWSEGRLRAPRDLAAAAPVDIDVVDAANVFVAVRLQPSRFSFTRGLLLRSRNGGETWTQFRLPAAGEIEFVDGETGWLAGGAARERLYATRDGGRTWRVAAPPRAVRGAASAVYGLPAFTAPEEGVLAVSLAAGGRRSALALYATADGGRSWQPATVVRLVKPLRFAAAVPTAFVEGHWLAAVDGGTRLVALTDGGAVRTTVGPLPGAVSRLEFASPAAGWAEIGRPCGRGRPDTCDVRVFATADGGLTWSRLRPR